MIIRRSNLEDLENIRELYKAVARVSGGIARQEHEITDEYVHNFLSKLLANGCGFVAVENNKIVAEIHTYSFGIACFKHVLGDTTICVHPDYQGKGVGRAIFETLLNDISQNRSDILRVELFVRSTNPKAIQLYENLGFVKEGWAEGRVLDPDGSLVADVPMRWLNPNFNK